MARKSIIEEQNLENQIKQMAKQGLNCLAISKKLNINREVVRQWCLKNNIVLTKRLQEGSLDKYKKFIDICEKALENNSKIKLNQTCKDVGIHVDVVRKILNKNPQYRQVIRNKKHAISEDKILSLYEATNRLPSNENSQVVGFDNGKYKIVTEDGYVYHKTSAKIKQGDPRNKCGAPHTMDAIVSKLESSGYKYLDGFTGNIKDSIKAEHLKCGKIRSNRLEGFARQECPYCSNNGSSKAESEILEWIKQWYPEAHSTRKIITPKELDVYIPSLNLAIEYCGLYWHNEDSPDPKTRNYHRDKMLKCNEKNIRLITIFEDEWIERNTQVKNFLKSVIGICDTKIFARKCQIKEVDKKTASNFLEQHHIQGRAPLKVAFGLFYQDELVGLVTGNQHHRKSDEFTLNRLVFKDGVQVIGGASKLLKYLLDFTKKAGYKRIVSWSDNRWSEGGVYKKCGFLLEEDLGSDYSYYIGQGKRESKQSNKKSNLLKKGATGSMDNTEKELSLSLGYSRIWDCGKKRWIINL